MCNSGMFEHRVDPNEQIVVELLKLMGEDPTREGLKETPKRYIKALGTWFGGYKYKDEDIAKVLKCFEDGSEGCDQLIVQTRIPFWSHCEHHLAPFFGEVHIGYIPNKRIVGLSKFTRLVEIFARRAQVQERITNQIADALMAHLQPKGCAVAIEARHSCMESRGVCRAGVRTDTIALRGLLLEDASAKAEFLTRIRVK